MKLTTYKTTTTNECRYCGYRSSKCRKNRVCSHYKKAVKTYLKNRKKANKLLDKYM